MAAPDDFTSCSSTSSTAGVEAQHPVAYMICRPTPPIREECPELATMVHLGPRPAGSIELWRIDYNQNLVPLFAEANPSENLLSNRPFHKPQWAGRLSYLGSAPPPIGSRRRIMKQKRTATWEVALNVGAGHGIHAHKYYCLTLRLFWKSNRATQSTSKLCPRVPVDIS